jgi:soluble lytic murein transglycosylase-like protein
VSSCWFVVCSVAGAACKLCLVCAVCTIVLPPAGAGAASVVENPPLPVPRPAAFANQQMSVSPAARGPANAAEGNTGTIGGATDPGSSRKAYRALIQKEAEKNGLPADIAESVAAIESGYDPAAIGTVGEIGLMQVRPETAAMLGFKGDLTELARPDVNIHYGVAYLGRAWQLANGDLCRALMKYRAGHGEETMSALSVTYCGRARAHLAAMGSPFGAGVAVPFVFDQPLPRTPAAKRGPRIRTAAVSRTFWAAQEARVKAITARIEAKWRRMASR